MFTRISNFTYGNYRIANIEADALDNNIELLIHIQKYEQESLRLLLGDSTYEEFMSNLELDSNGFYKVISTADQKWGWLLNGRSYTATALDSGCNCGCQSNGKHHWAGLVKKVATIQEKDVFETLMASYIFYNWSLNYRTLNLGVGEGRSESKSATPESSKNKRVDAWNEFVQWAYFGYSCTNVSLSNFLQNHKEEFPNVNEITLQPMTYYDI
jgi:hypothetical protein